MAKKKVALIGVGRMGVMHYVTMSEMTNVEVKYVFDPNFNLQKNSQIPGSLVTKDLATVLSDSEIASCIIAAPSRFHAELVISCAKAQKNIFCEKPISFDLEQLFLVKEICERQKVSLQVGFNRRFDDDFYSMKKLIDDGAVGNLHIVKITNRDPKRPELSFVKDSGGLFFDFNIHDFDTLRFITGDEVESVYAAGDALVDEQLKKYHDIDTAIISLTLKSGALAVIDCSRETGYGYDQRLEVLGPKGMIQVANHKNNNCRWLSGDQEQASSIPYSFVERYEKSYKKQLQCFFEKDTFDPGDLPSIDDAIAAVAVAEASKESLKTNKQISIAQFLAK